MTENDLLQYRSIKNEIKDLDKRINEAKKAEIIECGIVKGSSKYFPYTLQNFRVSGIDPSDISKKQETINNLIKLREFKRNELIKKQFEIEEYIANISDSAVRIIFRMHYIDGENQSKIARITHYTQGRISQIIKSYIKTNKINN